MADVSRLIDHVQSEANLDKHSATPLYLRVQRGIEQAIRTAMVEVNDALPAEREMAAALGVSRVTVRNAVRALVEKGILIQKHGAGTFVASPADRSPRQLASFKEDMQDRGIVADAQWLDRSIGLPTPEECEALEIMPDCMVSRLYRLRLADDEPMCVEHAVLPQSILPDPNAIELSLYAWLEDNDRHPTRAVQTLSARLLDISQARLLNVPTGSPSLYIERRSFLPRETYEAACGSQTCVANGDPEVDRPIEFVRSYYRGDLYQYVDELSI